MTIQRDLLFSNCQKMATWLYSLCITEGQPLQCSILSFLGTRTVPTEAEKGSGREPYSVQGLSGSVCCTRRARQAPAEPDPPAAGAARGGRSGSTARHVTRQAAARPPRHRAKGKRRERREPGGATGAGRARRAWAGRGPGSWLVEERAGTGVSRGDPGRAAGTGRRRAAGPAASPRQP